MTAKTIKTLLLSCVAALALAACQNTQDAAREQITSDVMEGNVAKQIFKEQKDNAGPGNVRFRQTVWLGSEASRSSNGMPLPAIVETPDAITLSSSNPMSLVEIARRVSLITGIEVVGANQLGVNRAGDAELADGNEDPRNIQAVIDYTGPLSGLLDMVAARFGVSWEYRKGVIQIFDVKTVAFTLIAPPFENELTSTVESTLNASTSGSSSSGTDNQQKSENGVISSTTLNYWKRVETDIEALLPAGTPYAVSPESGSVMVTANPAVLERVAAYVKDQNAKMGRQVAVSVRVLSIKTENIDNAAANLGATFMAVGGDLNIDVTPLAPGIITAATSALTGGNPITGGYAYTDGDMAFGTSALVDALSRRSDASLVTSAGVTTMNGQPAPVQISKDITYISSYDNSLTDAANSITPETSTLKTGFSLNVLPRILPNNTVVLNYILGISELDQMRQIGDTFPVEAPEVSSRGFQQNVMLRSGDTLVLAGFERADNSAEDSVGFLSFGKRGSQSHELVILLITPVIIEDPADLARMK